MSKYAALWEHIAKCDAPALTMTFAEIEAVCGIPLDHLFLRYKKELTDYGYAVEKISMKAQTVSFVKEKKDEV